MSRAAWLVVFIVLALSQLFWLFWEWRRNGFLSAFRLLAFSMLSLFLVGLQDGLGLRE